jgi:hypothetical protein
MALLKSDLMLLNLSEDYADTNIKTNFNRILFLVFDAWMFLLQ